FFSCSENRSVTGHRCCVLTHKWFLLVLASPEVSECKRDSSNDQRELAATRNQIATAQYECFQRMLKDSHHKKTGPMCNRTWDGWLCWDATEAGFTTEQHCPDYYGDFDPKEVASKVCTETGQWWRHPQSNRTWTNYTKCTANTNQGPVHAVFIAVGHKCLSSPDGLRSLSCQRITLHKNLFFSFVLNSIITIIWLTAVTNNQELMRSNSVSCKVIMFIHLYLLSCNYFWMLCEGIYLHTLIVVAVFAEKQHLMWYYLLGWGFPLVPALIHAIARRCYYNDKCMKFYCTSIVCLLYIMSICICVSIQLLDQLRHVLALHYTRAHLCCTVGKK
uniref:Calcitonin gene-related peptide type 1 receptor n=1 Tax=Myripristis murdjan TaxID=586833 RepID=A0A667WGZ3_9TELE